MIRKPLIFIFAILTMTNVQAGALSWPDCVTEASKNNGELQAAAAALRASEFTYRSAFSGYFPQISGNMSYSKSHTGPETLRDYGADFSANENLFAGFFDYAKVRQEKANYEIAAANLSNIKSKLNFDLKSAYANLVYATRSVSLSQDVARRRQENLRLVELRFESGRENKGSLLLSKAYLNSADLDLLQSRNLNEVSVSQLARVLGKSDEPAIEVEGNIPENLSKERPDFKKLLSKTPDVRTSIAQFELAEANIISARSGFLPSLNLNGTLGRQGSEWFPDQNHWTVGVLLSVPLFSGGKDFYGLKSSAASADAKLSTQENTEKVTLVKLKQTFAGFIEAGEKLSVDESFLKAALSRAEIARSKYKNGLLTFEDWDLIENDLVTRQKQFLQSQRDRIVAEATWEQAQGVGVIP